MRGRILKSLLVLCVAISFGHGQICKTGDVTLTANQCMDSDEFFNSTISVLPGSSITLACSVMDTGVAWNSSQFDMLLRVENAMMSANQAGIAFQFDTAIASPSVCANATATIANIQESMDGLDLVCLNTFIEFSSMVVINVIDPPPPVNLMATQVFNETVVSWIGLVDDPCPITNYSITINDSSPVLVAADRTQDSFPIVDECGSTLQINVSAMSAAGAGNINTTNLEIFRLPASLSVCAVIEFDQNSTRRTYLNMEWKMPSEVSVDPALNLNIEVSSVDVLQSALFPVSTTMYQVTDGVTFPGMFDAMVYFEGHKGSSCFSIRNQINVTEEFSMVSVSTVDVSSDTARFMLTINTTVFILTNDSVELSGGDGSCGFPDPTSKSLDLICTGLSAEMTYSVIINLSHDDNWLSIVITIDTPSAPLPATSLGPQGTSSLNIMTSSIISGMTTKPVSPTTTGTPPSSPMTPPPTDDVGSLSLIVGVVVAMIVIILLVIVVSVIIAIVYTKKKARKASLGCNTKDDSDDPVALVERKDPTTGEAGDPAYAPPKQVPHEQAPTGETYAVVTDKPRRTAPTTPQADTNYQDPSTIQREQAHTGDLYAMVNKESKPMYSEVQKQPDRVYADLDLKKKDEQGGASHKPASSEEKAVYSEIQHTNSNSPTGQEVVDVPLEESLYDKV